MAHNHLGGLNLLLFDCHVVTCTKGSAKRVPSPLPMKFEGKIGGAGEREVEVCERYHIRI